MFHITLFALFMAAYGIGIWVDTRHHNALAERYALFGACCALVIAVAQRDITIWPDTMYYIHEFLYVAPLQEFSFDNAISLYSHDCGFQILTAAIRSITSDWFIYLFIVSTLSFFFLYKTLRRYATWPLIGLVVYVARFMIGRDMMQIRQGFAIMLIIYATRYITDKRFGPFFVLFIIAASIHSSILIALPLFWLARWNPNGKTIAGLFVVAAGCSYMMPWLTEQLSGAINYVFGVKECYFLLGPYSHRFVGQGLGNPMIYYQLSVLMLFILAGSKIKSDMPDYQTVRNGYLYSTLLLIALSPMAVTAGRLSTIFATYEICIIPALLKQASASGRWQHLAAVTGAGAVLLGFWYKNIASYSSW